MNQKSNSRLSLFSVALSVFVLSNFAFLNSSWAATIYVKHDATGQNNGTSWANAYVDLQDALANAENGYDIWVSEGTYKPTDDGDQSVSFIIDKGIHLYGGFLGVETDLSEKDIRRSTILSGDIGTVGDDFDNSNTVIKHFTGPGTTASMRGFIVEKAVGNGMYVVGHSITIEYCEFRDNGGSGLRWVFSYGITSSNSSFSRNEYGISSGEGCLGIFENCSFSQNKIGINMISSSVEILNCTISNNERGVITLPWSGSKITHCTIVDNVCPSTNGDSTLIGVGVYNGGSMYIKNSIVANNFRVVGSSYIPDDFHQQTGQTHSTIFLGVNLIEFGDIQTIPGNITGEQENLKIGPLADNGGYTQTCALLADSPAIDAGVENTGFPLQDQRGYGRHGLVDIGAFEYKGKAPIYYVKQDAVGQNNGSSWTDAFTNLQFALKSRNRGEEIWVAAGTYKPSSGVDRDASFTISSNIKMYGGFAGSESSFEERNLELNRTVLSGDIGAQGDDTDNSFHTVTLQSSLLIDGITVENGVLGVISSAGITASIKNTVFRNNGTGFYNNSNEENLDFVNCTFNNNGKGFEGSVGDQKFIDCVFRDNEIGLYCHGYGHYSFIGCTLNGTTDAAILGLGCHFVVDLINSTITENMTYAIKVINNDCDVSYPLFYLNNCTIANNICYDTGSVVYGAAIFFVRNTIIANNLPKDIQAWFVSSEGYNIIGTGSLSAFNREGDITGEQPGLEFVLADNGGPTMTCALQPDSVAVDAGSCDPDISVDQRGVQRPQGVRCDIGAFEYQDLTIPHVESITITTSGPTNAPEVVYTVTFSEDVSGVTPDDFSLTGTATGGHVAAVDGSGRIYTVTANNYSGDGTLRLDVDDNDSILDHFQMPLGGFGEGNGNFFQGEAYRIDMIPPSAGFIHIWDNMGLTNLSHPSINLNSIGPSEMRFALTETGLESAQWITYSTSFSDFDISPGGDGEKRIWAEFRDEAGNIQTTHASDSTIYDATPPYAPRVEGSTPTNDTTPVWRWIPNSDERGIGVYQYKLDSNPWSSETIHTFFEPVDPLNEGSHTLCVQERDGVGNWSEPGIFVIVVDVTAKGVPTVSGVSPSNDNTPEWTWDTGGGSGLYRFKLHDEDFTNGGVNTSARSYYPVSILPDGEHTLFVQEADDAGNWSQSGRFTIQVDTGKPCSEAVSPPVVTDSAKTFAISYTRGDVYNNAVCGTVSSGSGISYVELWVQSPGSPGFQHVATDGIGSVDGLFFHTVDAPGVYRFYTKAHDRAGNVEDTPARGFDSQTIHTSAFPGYAIVAVGSVPGDEPGIVDHTLTACHVYRHLFNRNFTLGGDPADPLDNVKFYTPSGNDPLAQRKVGEDEYGGYLENAIRNAVETWALEKMRQLAGPLYLVLIDHGTPDTFYTADGFGFGAGDLDDWISTLRAGMAAEGIHQPIVVILGTCYSGTFIDDLSGPGRIIVTSTAADEVSYRGPRLEVGNVRDGEFFVTRLFNALGRGENLAAGFSGAVRATELHTDSGRTNAPAPYFDTGMQHPLLDDNGDGAGSNTLGSGGDGNLATTITLGFGTDAPPPVEVSNAGAEPFIISETSAHSTIWATVSDRSRMAGNPWVEIREPGMTLEAGTVVQQAVNLLRRELSWNPAENRFKADYYGFNTPGRYSLFFYVKDEDGFISPFKVAYVHKNDNGNTQPAAFALLSPENDESVYPETLLDWTDSADPDGDELTYTVMIYQYDGCAKNQPCEAESTDPPFSDPAREIRIEGLTRSACFIGADQGITNLSKCYWKVRAIDNCGAYYETESRVFFADANNPPQRKVVVFLKHCATNSPINGASVLFGNRSLENSSKDGIYIGCVTPGKVHNVDVSSYEYGSKNFGVIFVPVEGGEFNEKFVMFSIGDSVSILKTISGLESSSCIEADSNENGRLDMNDALYILQKEAYVR